MPVEQINGLGIAYEVIGQGRAVGHHTRRPFQQGRPRSPRAGPGAGRDREAGADLGPTEHGSLGGVLRRGLRIGHASRRAGRAPAGPGHDPGRHLRWVRWLTRLVAGGGPASRRGACARRLVDQWRAVRVADPRHALLRGFDRGGLAVRDGGGGRPAGMGRGPGAQSGQSGQALEPRTPAPSSRPSSSGCWPTALARTSWFPAYPMPTRRAMPLPALVFRSGDSDPHHTRATSERLADLLPGARAGRAPVG